MDSKKVTSRSDIVVNMITKKYIEKYNIICDIQAYSQYIFTSSYILAGMYLYHKVSRISSYVEFTDLKLL